ncbi:tyrosine-type recombinase/integrase [Chloroflexota bacterium]
MVNSAFAFPCSSRSRYNGKQLKPNTIKLLLKRWDKKAGVPRLHAHLCKHTFATNFLTYNCGDVFRLQQILSHTILEARRYRPTSFSRSLAPPPKVGLQKDYFV